MENRKRGRPRTDKPLVSFSIQLPAELRERIEKEAKSESRTIAGQIRHVLQGVYGPSMYKDRLMAEMEAAHPEVPERDRDYLAESLTAMKFR